MMTTIVVWLQNDFFFLLNFSYDDCDGWLGISDDNNKEERTPIVPTSFFMLFFFYKSSILNCVLYNW